MRCFHWQDQQPPAFFSSLSCLFKKMHHSTCGWGRGSLSSTGEKGGPGMHLGYSSSETFPVWSARPGVLHGPGRLLAVVREPAGHLSSSLFAPCCVPGQAPEENMLAVSTLFSLRPLQVKL